MSLRRRGQTPRPGSRRAAWLSRALGVLPTCRRKQATSADRGLRASGDGAVSHPPRPARGRDVLHDHGFPVLGNGDQGVRGAQVGRSLHRTHLPNRAALFRRGCGDADGCRSREAVSFGAATSAGAGTGKLAAAWPHRRRVERRRRRDLDVALQRHVYAPIRVEVLPRAVSARAGRRAQASVIFPARSRADRGLRTCDEGSC